MISPVRATAIVGLGSLISLAASVVAAKVLALVMGPDGVGLLGVTQSLLNISGLIAGLGVATGVVRALAAAGAQDDIAAAAALRRSSELLVFASGAVGMAALLVLRQPIAQLFLGSESRSGDVVLIGAALLLSALSAVEIGIINGYHRLRALTVATVANALLAQAVMIGFVLARGSSGIAPAMLTASGIGLAIAMVARSRAVGPVGEAVKAQELRSAGMGLLRFGLPYTASALVGTGAQFVIPVLVLNQLGQAEAGHYRAAATISVGYVAFLFTALAQDYYPRVAAAKPEELLELIEKRMRLVMALAVPIILALLGLAPLVIRLLYTSAFLPATSVLDWQLAGDLLKIPAWTMVFVILARGSTGRYFVVELLGGVTMVFGTWIGASLFGLAGAGIGYLASYAIYYPAVLFAVRRYAPVTPGRLQAAIVGLVVLTLFLFVLPSELQPLRATSFVALAVGMAALAWPRLWRLQRSGQL